MIALTKCGANRALHYGGGTGGEMYMERRLESGVGSRRRAVRTTRVITYERKRAVTGGGGHASAEKDAMKSKADKARDTRFRDYRRYNSVQEAKAMVTA